MDEIPEETKDELVEDVPPNSGASQQASQQTSQESVSKGTKKAAASKTSKKRGKAAKQEDADEAVDDVSNTENEIPVEVNKPDSQPEPKETAKRGRKKVEKEKSSKSEAAIIEEPVAMDVDVVEQVVGEGKKAVSTLRSLSGTVAPTAPQTKPMLRRIEDDEMDMTVEQLLRTIIGEQKASLEAEGNRLKASYLAKVDLVRDLMG